MPGIFSALRRMCLVNNDGIFPVRIWRNGIRNEREFLYSCNNDTTTFLYSILQILTGVTVGIGCVTNSPHFAIYLGKLLHITLHLLIEYTTVSDDQHTIKECAVVSSVLVEVAQPECQPCDGVRFSGTSRMLYEVAVSCSSLCHVFHQFMDGSSLVIAWKNESFAHLFIKLPFLIVIVTFLFDLHSNKVLEQVHQIIAT